MGGLRARLQPPFKTIRIFSKVKENKGGYTATPVACRWAGAMFEVIRPFGEEQKGQRIKIIKKRKI